MRLAPLFLVARDTLAAAFLLGSVACVPTVPGACRSDADCGAGKTCSTLEKQCVECEDASDCADGFCCRGECKALTTADAHCGCEALVGGAPGKDCTAFELGDAQSGGACQSEGALVTAETVDDGTCGCTESGSAHCGEDAAGLVGLCVTAESSDGHCVGQSPDACGADARVCAPDLGGTLCKAAETGFGTCGCSESDPGATCRQPVMTENGQRHLVADTCAPDGTCACFGAADRAACDSTGATPDCCGDGCVDLASDPNNCGGCGVSCGDGACVGGACSCSTATDCFAPGGSINNPGGVGNQCNNEACVCNGYVDDGQNNAACPVGSYCCFAGGDVTVTGCCAVPCGEATPAECTTTAP